MSTIKLFLSYENQRKISGTAEEQHSRKFTMFVMERDGTRLHCDSSDLLILSAVQISELADHQRQGNLSFNFEVVDIDRCDVVVVVVVKHTYLPSKSG